MTFQEYLDNIGMTKYRLSKLSGVPKTTINDICSGRSEMEKCSGKTILLLAEALRCKMEDLMSFEHGRLGYDGETGLPKDKGYLEKNLPDFLQKSINQMILSWEAEDKGQRNPEWDLDWSELNADINSAEVDQLISSEQAWYLREKYLRMERSGT